MSTSLSSLQNNNRKKFKLSAFFLFLPSLFWGQSLTGLWTGALSNDSSTVRKDQLFEIVLTEYKGKVYGYSRSEFIVNDTLYYIVKRVKGTIQGDVCEVTDDDIIAYNFRGRLDKGVKVTSTFRRNGSDSAWYLDGTWKTNATKKYYSVTGKINLGQEKDLTASKIFPHLEELKVADEIAFYRERQEGLPVAKIAKPQRVKTEYTFNNDPAPAIAITAPHLQRAEPDPVIPDLKKPDNSLTRTETKELNGTKTTVAVAAPNLVRAEPGPITPDIKKPDHSLAKTEIKNTDTGPTTLKPALESKGTLVTTTGTTQQDKAVAKTEIASSRQPASANNKAHNNPPVKANNTTAPSRPVADNKNAAKTTTPVSNNNTATAKISTPAEQNKENRNIDAAAIAVVPPKSLEELTKNASTIAGRKSEFSQVVDFRSDSLVLALYDNGEIDGDTVSVFMNGEMIMARQGLKASAIRKTIYFQPGQKEDFTLVLFADNLGKYPPNTGLLVVYDGEDIYHLRFSSDFQKSTGIVFRRKK